MAALTEGSVSRPVLNGLMPIRRAKPRPVAGMICIRPMAPADERICGVEGRLLRGQRGDQVLVEAVLGGAALEHRPVVQRVEHAHHLGRQRLAAGREVLRDRRASWR